MARIWHAGCARDRWCNAAHIRRAATPVRMRFADFPRDKKFRQLHPQFRISATEPRFRRLRFRPPQPQKGSLNDTPQQDDEVGLSSARRADHHKVAFIRSNRVIRSVAGVFSSRHFYSAYLTGSCLAGLSLDAWHSYDVHLVAGVGTVIRRILVGMMTLPLCLCYSSPIC